MPACARLLDAEGCVLAGLQPFESVLRPTASQIAGRAMHTTSKLVYSCMYTRQLLQQCLHIRSRQVSANPMSKGFGYTDRTQACV